MASTIFVSKVTLITAEWLNAINDFVYAPNLRGRTTLAAAATASVSFVTVEPSADYYVTLGGNAEETFWVTDKTVGGFTLHSSNATSTATVDWILLR